MSHRRNSAPIVNFVCSTRSSGILNEHIVLRRLFSCIFISFDVWFLRHIAGTRRRRSTSWVAPWARASSLSTSPPAPSKALFLHNIYKYMYVYICIYATKRPKCWALFKKKTYKCHAPHLLGHPRCVPRLPLQVKNSFCNMHIYIYIYIYMRPIDLQMLGFFCYTKPYTCSALHLIGHLRCLPLAFRSK